MSKPVVIIAVHGILARDLGRKSVGNLRPYAESRGYKFVLHSYGFKGVLGARLFNGFAAKSLALKCNQWKQWGYRVVLLGHSNGVAVMDRATKRHGACAEGSVCINGAIDSDREFADHLRWVDVWYTSDDKWTKLAGLIPFTKWGNQGAKGYVGEDEKVSTINASSSRFLSPASGHSGILMKPSVDIFGPKIMTRIRSNLRRVKE